MANIPALVFLKEETTHVVSSINELTNLQNLKDGQHVIVKSYYVGGDPRSGGEVTYHSGDTSPVDNIFVFPAVGGTFKRIFADNTINILQGGLQGVGDETSLLNNLLSACANQASLFNYTRKIEIDGLNMRVNTSGQINLNLTLCNLKDIDIIPTLPAQSSFNKTTGCALYVFGIDGWTSTPVLYRRRGREVLNNVSIIAPQVSQNTIGLYLAPQVEGNFANSVFEQVVVSGFTHAVVLTDNTYLINFSNCAFTGCSDYLVVTSVYLGIDTKFGNMGENIRFTNSSFSNSKAVIYIDHEMWVNFAACSFDYNGLATDTTGWFTVIGANAAIHCSQCHFEAGNANAQLGKYLFYTDSIMSAFTISGGTLMMGDSNQNDYVFYSTAPRNHNFTIENVWGWCSGIARVAWSNTGMGRFRIFTNANVTNIADVHFNGIQAPNKSLTKDYGFHKTVQLKQIIDPWYVSDGGDTTRTSPTSSSGVVMAPSTTTDDVGNTVPCLVASIKKTDQSVYLLIKRPTMRTAMSPGFRIRFKTSAGIGGGVWLSLIPVDVAALVDVKNNVFTPTVDHTRWTDQTYGYNIQLSSTANSVTQFDYLASPRLFPTLETYDYYQLTINFTYNGGFDFSILSVECYDMDN